MAAIDIHVHLTGVGPQSGCRMSARLRYGPVGIGWRLLYKVPFSGFHDARLLENVLSPLAGSTELSGAVLLAMDAAYDARGNRLEKWTHLYVPTDYAARARDKGNKQAGPRLFLGASVHPDRPGALEELSRVAEMGAVLVKWVPASQNIDPGEKRHVPFYRKLAELSLPLLCHAGREHTLPLPGAAQDTRRMEDPGRLALALENGATVIGAHCGAGLWPWEPDFHRDFIRLMDQARVKGWNLYGDVAAFTLPAPHRVRCVAEIRDALPHDRLILGSDFPALGSCLWKGAVKEGDPAAWRRARQTQNPFDRNVWMVRALGFDERVLSNAQKVLRAQEKTAWPQP